MSWGYDGIKLLAKAIKMSGSIGGTEIKDAFYQIKDLQGASGRIEFTREGSSKQLMKVFAVKNGILALNDVQ